MNSRAIIDADVPHALLSTLARSAPGGTYRRRARLTPATDRASSPRSTPRTLSMSSAVALPARLAPRFRPADAPHRGAAARGSGSRLRARPLVRAAGGGAAPAPDRPKAKVAVFVSGGGSNLRALHAAMLDGRVNAEVVAVVSNKPDCGGVAWAEDLGIPTLAYPPKKTDADGLTPDDLVHQLVDVHGAEYVCLAGYLRLIIPPELCRAYERRMLNIHPALLPAFGGKGMHGHHVHEAVVASGARFSGPTVHFVNEKFDEGKILAQRVVPVRAGFRRMTSRRGSRAEHVVFAHALGALVDGRVVFREDGVPYIEGEDE